MRRLFTTRRRKVVAALVAVAAVATTTAVAAWVVTLNQPASRAKLGSLTVTAVAPTTSPTDVCLPGSACDANLRISNASGTALTLTGFTAATGVSVALNGGSGACIVGDFAGKITIPAKSGLSIAVPPGVSDVTIPDLLVVSDTIGTQCQGQEFTVTPTGGFLVTVSTP